MKASDTQGAQGAPHGDLHAESDSKSADDMELSCERVAEEKNADIECSDDDEEDFRNDLVDGIDIDPDEFDYFIFDDLSSSQLPTQASCYRVFSIMVIEFLFESGAVLKLYLITLSNLANAYYSLERHSAAQAICACALALEEPGKTLMAKIGGSIDGILAKLCYRQGLVKMQLRNFDEAVEYFKKAASLDPGNVAINSALALAKKFVPSHALLYYVRPLIIISLCFRKCAMASKSAALQYSKMFA